MGIYKLTMFNNWSLFCCCCCLFQTCRSYLRLNVFIRVAHIHYWCNLHCMCIVCLYVCVCVTMRHAEVSIDCIVSCRFIPATAGSFSLLLRLAQMR